MSLSSCTHECEVMNLYCGFRAVLDTAPLKTSFLWQILSLNHFKNIFKESLFRLKHFISLLLLLLFYFFRFFRMFICRYFQGHKNRIINNFFAVRRKQRKHRARKTQTKQKAGKTCFVLPMSPIGIENKLLLW